MRARWFWAWCLAAALSAVDYGIRVDASSPWSDPTGYTPILVTIQSPKAGLMRLSAETRGTQAVTTITVQANQKAQATLLMPPATDDYFYLSRLQWELIDVTSGEASIGYSASNDDLRFILVNDSDQIAINEWNKALNASKSTELMRSVAPEQLPDRWQGYPDWLTLLITPSGQAGLNDAQRQAIQSWALAGGTVIVTTAAQVPQWRQLGISVQHIPLADTDPKLSTSATKSALTEVAARHDDHQRWHAEEHAVPGTESVPVSLFVIIAIGFAAVVGPLNLWWVRRRGSRTFFLITTPVLSFATCIVLLIASILADGISTKRSAAQLVLLFPGLQQAVTFTGGSYFAAFATSYLDLDHQAKLHLLPTVDSSRYGYRGRRYRESGRELTAIWGQSQHISGPVVPAREHRQLGLTEIKPERRRVLIERMGNVWQVRNGLGVTMRDFHWVDPDGRWWFCAEVADGSAVPLSMDGPGRADSSATTKTALLAKLPTDLRGRLPRNAEHAFAATTAQPLHFMAELSGPLDPLPGPTATDVDETPTYIAGILPPNGGNR